MRILYLSITAGDLGKYVSSNFKLSELFEGQLIHNNELDLLALLDPYLASNAFMSFEILGLTSTPDFHHSYHVIGRYIVF